MSRIHIKNDGKPGYMTEITDVETGKSIEYVVRVAFAFDANRHEEPIAILDVAFPIIDVIVDAEIRRVCPVCGKPTKEHIN